MEEGREEAEKEAKEGGVQKSRGRDPDSFRSSDIRATWVSRSWRERSQNRPPWGSPQLSGTRLVPLKGLQGQAQDLRTSFRSAHLHGSAPPCAINFLSTWAGQGEGRNSSALSSTLRCLPSSSETQGTPESPNPLSGQTQRALHAGGWFYVPGRRARGFQLILEGDSFPSMPGVPSPGDTDQ